MTRELKALMDQESDRSDHYFAPDPAAILAAGRRRNRVRNLGVAATVLTALVVLTAGVGLFLPEDEAPVAGLPGRSQDAYKQCDTSNGRRLGKDSWTWPAIVNLTDDYGSASLRRDPNDPDRVAYCVTQPDPPSGDLPLGQRNGILVRKSRVDAKTSVTSVYGRVYQPDATVVVKVVTFLNPTKQDAASYEFSAPSDPSTATIGGTYYLYRTVENAPWPGYRPSVSVTTFTASGLRVIAGTW
ncbi:hypothetical protein ABZS29_03435 [Kribbella sp. NPDC005582]|uniref:hypothetical protein n=1 Tax=Kribbella sp. NPDC005582 TaxID=3156893 RepID=UPI0033A42840